MIARMMKWSLLTMLCLAGAIAVSLAIGILLAFQQGAGPENVDQPFESRLFIPPVLQAEKMDDGRRFHLDVTEASHSFINGLVTPTKSFGLSYLGPTIRARKGERIRIDVRNHLRQSTTVHWHGMILPAAMDGGPHQAIPPGNTWHAEWEILNEAATYWYHPHSMHRTGREVYEGLAGFLIVDDDNSDALSLPADYGETDIPLLIQDRQFNADGSFSYEADPRDLLGRPGMLGDTILANGTVGAFVELPRTLVRFRLLNGSNARRFNLAFADNRRFHQIATDGGLLEEPVEMTRLMLSPGERAEIVVDLSNDSDSVMMISRPIYDRNIFFTGFKTLVGSTRDENQGFSILELRPVNDAAADAELPARLTSMPELPADDGHPDLHVQLSGNRINRQVMDHDRIDHVSRADSHEIWEIEALDMPHPFHVHGVQFRILSRDGAQPPANERGWKDTVLVHQDERVRILVPMPPFADRRIPYMFHCHILEHEDAGMMGQFLVVDDRHEDAGVSDDAGVVGASHH